MSSLVKLPTDIRKGIGHLIPRRPTPHKLYGAASNNSAASASGRMLGMEFLIFLTSLESAPHTGDALTVHGRSFPMKNEVAMMMMMIMMMQMITMMGVM